MPVQDVSGVLLFRRRREDRFCFKRKAHECDNVFHFIFWPTDIRWHIIQKYALGYMRCYASAIHVLYIAIATLLCLEGWMRGREKVVSLWNSERVIISEICCRQERFTLLVLDVLERGWFSPYNSCWKSLGMKKWKYNEKNENVKKEFKFFLKL